MSAGWRAADVSLAVLVAVAHGFGALLISFIAVMAGAGTYDTACNDQPGEGACGTRVNLAAALAGLGPWVALVIGVVLAAVLAARGRPAVIGTAVGLGLGILCVVAGAALLPS